MVRQTNLINYRARAALLAFSLSLSLPLSLFWLVLFATHLQVLGLAGLALLTFEDDSSHNLKNYIIHTYTQYIYSYIFFIDHILYVYYRLWHRFKK